MNKEDSDIDCCCCRGGGNEEDDQFIPVIGLILIVLAALTGLAAVSMAALGWI